MKVSVHMLTYNHEKYIEKAIKSVLMQKTNFPYELIIGEDCSTDKTREIVKKYQKLYPDIVKPILYETNMGLMHNYRTVFENCSGDYIATIDGDDCWSDDTKLQQEADILDAKEHISIVAHSVDFNYIDKNRLDKAVHSDNKREFDLDYFIVNNSIDSVALMFRREVLDDKPELWYTAPYGDHILKVMCLLKGNCYFIKKAMAVYNIQSESFVHKNEAKFLRQQIAYYTELIKFLPDKKHLIDNAIDETRFILARLMLKDGNKADCKEQFNLMKKNKTSKEQSKISYKYHLMVSKNNIRWMIAKFIPSLKDTNY